MRWAHALVREGRDAPAGRAAVALTLAGPLCGRIVWKRGHTHARGRGASSAARGRPYTVLGFSVARDDCDQALDELVRREEDSCSAIEARRLEAELDVAICQQRESVVADRRTGTVAKELLEAVARTRRHAHGRVKVEAFELSVMAKGLSCATQRPIRPAQRSTSTTCS